MAGCLRGGSAKSRARAVASDCQESQRTVMNLIGVIESAGLPALRVIATIALLFMAGVGLFIYHRRHRFFDRDAAVDNDFPVVRHMRTEEVVLVWGGLTILTVSILLQVWLA